MTSRHTFHMAFEPMTIEHLGLRLYSTLPPVLSELVSNAYDAESPVVEVSFPTDKVTTETEVIVRDYGHGMDADELEREYLPIGRNRRGEDSSNSQSKNGKRTVTGRKGLGKLSSFGVAEEMEIRAIKSGNAWTLRLNYDEMKKWAKSNPGKPYEPVVVKERTGKTSECEGVEIRLRKLRRTKSIDEAIVRRGLARRLNVIGPGFKVVINGAEISPGERTRREECSKDQSWDLADTPAGAMLEAGDVIHGWVGFVPGASQTGRGVDIFANGKAAELGSFFNYSSTSVQFARSHLVGEVHANFLDEGEDLISTARNSVVWESAKSQALQSWGQSLLRWAFDQWL
ncbi:MAG: ATP-binding protein, partial [Nitrospirae bacterium]|nr:ATP-binding protein [Nitrospirota bacterium]